MVWSLWRFCIEDTEALWCGVQFVLQIGRVIFTTDLKVREVLLFKCGPSSFGAISSNLKENVW